MSRWMTKRRKVVGTKKKKICGGEMPSGSPASPKTSIKPSKLPFQIWKSIKPEEYEAFVAKNTTLEAIVRIFY